MVEAVEDAVQGAALGCCFKQGEWAEAEARRCRCGGRATCKGGGSAGARARLHHQGMDATACA